MIQGRSNFVYRIKDTNTFVSLGLKDQYDTTPLHVDVNIVHGDVLDIEAFRNWRPEYKEAEFLLEGGKYVCGWAIEKMSKSMYNVVNPDMIVEKYGADTLRLYEMFLGPVEQSKPWDTNGIDGCHRFLKKFWALFYGRDDKLIVDDREPSADELKAVHKLIKKVTQDIEQFSYNTSISAFMICVNELGQLKCHNRELLADLVVLMAPFAPHIAEELWQAIGGEGSVCDARWPEWDEQYLVENTVQLTVSFNGKARFQMQFAADADNATIQEAVLADERSQKYMGGKQVVKRHHRAQEDSQRGGEVTPPQPRKKILRRPGPAPARRNQALRTGRLGGQGGPFGRLFQPVSRRNPAPVATACRTGCCGSRPAGRNIFTFPSVQAGSHARRHGSARQAPQGKRYINPLTNTQPYNDNRRQDAAQRGEGLRVHNLRANALYVWLHGVPPAIQDCDGRHRRHRGPSCSTPPTSPCSTHSS